MIFYTYVAEALFFAFIFLVLFGSLLAVRTQVLMHAVLGLAVSLLGVAGLYLYLGSVFMSLMQILIYVGAVCIVIVFGIMVGYTPSQVATQNIKSKNQLLATAAAAAAFFLLIVTIGETVWVPAAVKTGDFSVEYLGRNLLYKYCLVFELISVVLLTAIVGSIILARGGREEVT